MNGLQIFLGILLLVVAVFLIIAVLMQSGKSKRLSGTIAGGAETFFGKTKGKKIDKLLSKLTTAFSILFVVLVLVVYWYMGRPVENETPDTSSADDQSTVSTVSDTSVASVDASAVSEESSAVSEDASVVSEESSAAVEESSVAGEVSSEASDAVSEESSVAAE